MAKQHDAISYQELESPFLEEAALAELFARGERPNKPCLDTFGAQDEEVAELIGDRWIVDAEAGLHDAEEEREEDLLEAFEFELLDGDIEEAGVQQEAALLPSPDGEDLVFEDEDEDLLLKESLEEPDFEWHELAVGHEAGETKNLASGLLNELWFGRLDLNEQSEYLIEALLDPSTEQYHDVVKALQVRAGLTPDGILGPRTWGSIRESLEHQVTLPRADKANDIKFELELNYGLERLVSGEPVGVPFMAPGAMIGEDVVTTHKHASHGFKVVMDGPRMEIETRRFGLEDLAELDRITRNMVSFAQELRARCGKQTPRTVGTTSRRVGSAGRELVGGKVRDFHHPLFLHSDFVAFPIRSQKSWFRQSCGIGASPQVTFDMPLDSVMGLVEEIRASERSERPIRLTGSRTARVGLRSDALYDAHDAVIKDFRGLVRQGRFRSTELTKRLAGFVILLVQYLRTSELSLGPLDWEKFAKAYVPVVVHTHFISMFDDILSAAERDVFLKAYGAPPVRQRLFDLATDRPGAKDGSASLFPDQTHVIQLRDFGKVLTWNDFVDSAIDPGAPIHTTAGDLSLPTSLATASKGTATAGPSHARIPGVRLELRRMGHRWWSPNEWSKMTHYCYGLARKLNGIK